MALTSAPILHMPTDDGPYRVEADSSDYATGAVLSQEQEGVWYPIAYMSRSLNEVERNYPIYDKELLAVIRALEEWRHYLEGAMHRFEILTDHKNLEYFQTARKLNRRQARWSLFLSRFDFALKHRPGKSSGKPDALSRRADHGDGKDDNQDVVLLKPELFIHAVQKEGHQECPGVGHSLLKKIRQASRGDTIQSSMAYTTDQNQWTNEQGLILYQGKVYVPSKGRLRYDVIREHHDTPIAGHPGRDKTLELVSRNYWWPKMRQDYDSFYRKRPSPHFSFIYFVL